MQVETMTITTTLDLESVTLGKFVFYRGRIGFDQFRGAMHEDIFEYAVSNCMITAFLVGDCECPDFSNPVARMSVYLADRDVRSDRAVHTRDEWYEHLMSPFSEEDRVFERIRSGEYGVETVVVDNVAKEVFLDSDFRYVPHCFNLKVGCDNDRGMKALETLLGRDDVSVLEVNPSATGMERYVMEYQRGAGPRVAYVTYRPDRYTFARIADEAKMNRYCDFIIKSNILGVGDVDLV